MSGTSTLAFFGGTGYQEIAVVLVVLLLVFGNKVPEIMRSLGKGVSQFKRGLRDAENELRRDVDVDHSRTGPAKDDSHDKNEGPQS